MRYLSDEEIQDYLDGNLTQRENEIKEILRKSSEDREKLAEFKLFYGALSEEPEFTLSPSFAQDISATVDEQKAERFMYRLSNFILWGTGAAAVVIVLIMFTDLKKLLGDFGTIFSESGGIFESVYMIYKNAVETTGLGSNTFLLIVFVIAIIFLLDRLISRARKSATSANSYMWV